MGFFSKASKPNPKITFEGVEFEFDRGYAGWRFGYRGTEFCSPELQTILPLKAELDAILATLALLMPELQRRLQKGLSEWGDSRLGEGETYWVDVKDFARDRTFSVSWSDGHSWGDLGVEFTIKDNAIVDEAWGD